MCTPFILIKSHTRKLGVQAVLSLAEPSQSSQTLSKIMILSAKHTAADNRKFGPQMN